MEDEALLERLLAGDESAFTTLVNRYHRTLVQLARQYVRTDASAEDVAQDTWMAVVRGVDRFEGRSSLRTWLFRILVNRARSTGSSEARTVPVDPTWSAATELSGRFDRGGMWVEPPVPFTDAVEDGIVNKPTVHLVRQAIDQLGEPQRSVVTLRDVEGQSTMEVASLLGLSPSNVRVMLHRSRQKIRAAIEGAGQDRSR